MYITKILFFFFLCMNIKGSLDFFFLTEVIEKVLLETLSGLQASIYFRNLTNFPGLSRL